MTDATRTAPALDDLRAMRDQIIALAARHRASNVRVFGSVARGDATPDSDIDFLVTFEEGASLYDLSGLWQDLQELIGHSVDVVSDHAGLRDRFRQRITRDVVAL
jgi:predicted nucleotidyltransferase